jgi:hypothetical protein
MRALTSIDAVWRGSPRASCAPARANANGSKSGASGTGDGDPSRDPPKRPLRLQVELVSQEGTKAHDPFRDAPRLIPAFVTQLLGQAMAGGRVSAPRGAYGAADIKAALLLDTRL